MEKPESLPIAAIASDDKDFSFDHLKKLMTLC